MPKKQLERFSIIPGAVFLRAAKELTPGEFRVLAAILLCHNWRTGKSWPTVKRLREYTGLSEDSVGAAKSKLMRLGYIHLSWRWRKGGGHVIQVLFDKAGNPLEIPGLTPGKFRVNPPPISVVNLREKDGVLPTEAQVKSAPRTEAVTEARTKSYQHGDLSALECSYLRDGKNRLRLSTKLASVSAGGDALEEWRQVQGAVCNYHQARNARGLPCDYHGCLEVPLAKIEAMRAATLNPIAYLAASLTDELGKEEDRAQAQRAVASTARDGSGGTVAAGTLLSSIALAASRNVH